jgi:hypothetical protein
MLARRPTRRSKNWWRTISPNHCAIAAKLALRDECNQQGNAFGGLDIRQPVHRIAAGIDLALRRQRANAAHRVGLHAEQDHGVVGRLQVYDTGRIPSAGADQFAPKLPAARRRHGVSDPRRLRLRCQQRSKFALQPGGGRVRVHLGVDQQLGLRRERERGRHQPESACHLRISIR